MRVLRLQRKQTLLLQLALKQELRAKRRPIQMCKRRHKRSLPVGRQQALRLTLRRRIWTWDPRSGLPRLLSPRQNRRPMLMRKQRQKLKQRQILRQRLSRRRRRKAKHMQSPSQRRTMKRIRKLRTIRAAQSRRLHKLCHSWALVRETR